MWTALILVCGIGTELDQCHNVASDIMTNNERDCYTVLASGINYFENLDMRIDGYLCHNWHPEPPKLKGEKS